MGLKDKVLAANQRQGGKCPAALLIARLAKKDAQDLTDLLAMPVGEMPSAQIERGLKEIGEFVHRDRLSLHRRGACPCGAS